MTCVNELLHGGSHAFRDELYHKQRASPFMVAGIVARCEAGQGSRLEMHRRDRAGHHASRRRPLHFHQRRLPRLGQGTVRSGRDDGLGRRLAQDAACLGTAVERRLDRPAAPTHAPSGVERRHRLALAALLRAAVPKPQRTLLRPAQTGNRRSFTPTPRPASWNTDGVTRWS